jgi:hypothetical protein
MSFDFLIPMSDDREYMFTMRAQLNQAYTCQAEVVRFGESSEGKATDVSEMNKKHSSPGSLTQRGVLRGDLSQALYLKSSGLRLSSHSLSWSSSVPFSSSMVLALDRTSSVT